MNQCKGCRASVRVSEEDIKRSIEAVTGNKDIKIVSMDEYKSRMELCRGCKSLTYGTTCRHSGALVSVVAWMEDKHCPAPTEAMW